MSEVTKFGTQALYRKLLSKSEFLESRFSDSRTLTDLVTCGIDLRVMPLKIGAPTATIHLTARN